MAWFPADVYDDSLVSNNNNNNNDCFVNSVSRNSPQLNLSMPAPEGPVISSGMKGNVYTRQPPGKVDKTIPMVTSNNRNNNNDAPEWDELGTLGNQLVALLTGYTKFVDIDSIARLLRAYSFNRDDQRDARTTPASDLVEVSCTSSPADVPVPATIVDVIAFTGPLDQVVAAADAFLRQLLRPVFGEVPAEPIASDWPVPPTVRHVLKSVDLVSMLITLVAALKGDHRTDPLPEPVLV